MFLDSSVDISVVVASASIVSAILMCSCCHEFFFKPFRFLYCLVVMPSQARLFHPSEWHTQHLVAYPDYPFIGQLFANLDGLQALINPFP